MDRDLNALVFVVAGQRHRDVAIGRVLGYWRLVRLPNERPSWLLPLYDSSLISDLFADHHDDAASDSPRPQRRHSGIVSQFEEHLARIQDIAARAREFRANDASNPKTFSKTVVEDLGALAEAVADLIARAEI